MRINFCQVFSPGRVVTRNVMKRFTFRKRKSVRVGTLQYHVWVHSAHTHTKHINHQSNISNNFPHSCDIEFLQLLYLGFFLFGSSFFVFFLSCGCLFSVSRFAFFSLPIILCEKKTRRLWICLAFLLIYLYILLAIMCVFLITVGFV